MYADELEIPEIPLRERLAAAQSAWDRFEARAWEQLDELPGALSLILRHEGRYWIFVRKDRRVVGSFLLETAAISASAAITGIAR